MAKRQHNYRISSEVDQLLKFEAARLTEELGKKTSEADVIEFAVTAWMVDAARVNTPVNTAVEGEVYSLRRSVAQDDMKEAAENAPAPKPIPRKAESVAERKARETKEHIAKLAACDTIAREAGRDDIEYDPENVLFKSVLHVTAPVKTKPPVPQYEVKPKDCKPLTRPHGSTEAKRRREQ